MNNFLEIKPAVDNHTVVRNLSTRFEISLVKVSL